MNLVNNIGQRLDLRTDLVLRYRFQETSGDAKDSSGNDYNGTVTGATQTINGVDIDGVKPLKTYLYSLFLLGVRLLLYRLRTAFSHLVSQTITMLLHFIPIRAMARTVCKFGTMGSILCKR